MNKKKIVFIVCLIFIFIAGSVFVFYGAMSEEERNNYFSELKKSFTIQFDSETEPKPEETEPPKTKPEEPTENQTDISGYDTTLYVIAQEAISGSLKNPKGAEFAPMQECTMQRNGSLMAIQGYVDATNGFGATIREDFTLQINLIDKNSFLYDTVYIQIGNETAGEFIPLK